METFQIQRLFCIQIMLQEFIEKTPADPFEAEMLAMTEAVATEAKNKAISKRIAGSGLVMRHLRPMLATLCRDNNRKLLQLCLTVNEICDMLPTRRDISSGDFGFRLDCGLTSSSGIRGHYSGRGEFD